MIVQVSPVIKLNGCVNGYWVQSRNIVPGTLNKSSRTRDFCHLHRSIPNCFLMMTTNSTSYLRNLSLPIRMFYASETTTAFN
ncbi:hypothetical protein PISMIDRAFT_686805 [Pisolithus microcarpus 441]|uniref:Uncharacterized protein n=1 Tax=Pisolithus microcarpus 441 TaxID=765257 RepID=A0A0C9XUC6_9AGAM|nr:hypothetical protein BKA83DRAFT_686805 [Pisolithus microcarpus]KIK15975.1 hypothetical protein PISMIDRAFT_686805 [Pisolithus microcarpus 441]